MGEYMPADEVAEVRGFDDDGDIDGFLMDAYDTNNGDYEGWDDGSDDCCDDCCDGED